jgi:hypothetical protein
MADLIVLGTIFTLGLGLVVLRSTVFAGGGSDNYGHLIHIRDIRESGHRQSPTLSSNVMATGGRYAYPYLMHWVLSFLSGERIEWIERNLGVLMDVCLWTVFGALGVTGVLDPAEMGVCLLLFATTPEFVRPDRAQSHSLSARKPGLVLTSVALLAAGYWIHEGVTIMLGPALLAGAAVFLTNKFSVQALVAIVGVLALVSDPLWGLFFTGSFAIAVVATRGHYFRVLAGHLRHLHLYVTYLQHHHRKVGSKTILPTALVVSALEWLRGTRSRRDVLLEAHNNIPLQGLVNNPFVVPAFAVAVGAQTGVPDYLTVWVAAGIGAFLLTALPGLRFLGEPERYLEYVFVPAAIVVGTGAPGGPRVVQWLLWGTIAFGAGIVLVYAFLSRSIDGGGEDEAFADVVTFFEDLDPSTVVVQPLNRGKELSYRTGQRGVWFGGNLSYSRDTITAFKRLHPEWYPYVTDDVSWLEDRYDPDWVLFECDRLDGTTGMKPPSDESPVFQNDGYAVYRFDQLVDR